VAVFFFAMTPANAQQGPIVAFPIAPGAPHTTAGHKGDTPEAGRGIPPIVAVVLATQGSITFTGSINGSGTPPPTSSYQVTTEDGTAIAGQNYVSFTGTVNCQGFSCSSFTITILDDTNSGENSPPVYFILHQYNCVNLCCECVPEDFSVFIVQPPSTPSQLTILNPFAPYAQAGQAPPTVSVSGLSDWPPPWPEAGSLAADGQSAVVLAYESQSNSPVTFSISASGTSSSAIGSVDAFEPNYLVDPKPPSASTSSYVVDTPAYGDAGGNNVFLALLWAPNAMPEPEVSATSLTITATQQGQNTAPQQATIMLEPPPLLLIHGIWSSAKGEGFTQGSGGLYDWIAAQYPHSNIFGVDYSPWNAYSFTNSATQATILLTMKNAISSAATSGMAARTVDVVAHSMGGLATRYFLSTTAYKLVPSLLQNSVHTLITIGMPYAGTPLATTVWNNRNATPAVLGAWGGFWCQKVVSCTLAEVLAATDHVVELPGSTAVSAVQSLEPGSQQLQEITSTKPFYAIIGQAPLDPISVTEALLDTALGIFLPGQTIASIVGEPNDSIVPGSSQNPPAGAAADTQLVLAVVHANLCRGIFIVEWVCPDVGETQSQAFWNLAYDWLTGLNVAPSNQIQTPFSTSSAPLPNLDLTGYTEVPATNVTFLPASGSTLPINSITNITATSSTKTITEILVPQIVTDPTDTALLYSTQPPFSIPFIPSRLGTGNFGPIAVFSDNTYASTTLNYTFQPTGTPTSLRLDNTPQASMTVGGFQIVKAYALYSNGEIDVTGEATYAAGSGTSNVFSISSGGVVTATGNGVDLLNVTYAGVTAAAPIPVGSCTFSLTPTNQLVPYTASTVPIQVTTQQGCAWTASSNAWWAPLTQATGNGSGSITVSAAANNSGATQSGTISVGRAQALLTQAATACTYDLTETLIDATAAGTSGWIIASTTCPVIASSNASWVSVATSSPSVNYVVAANNGAAERFATLTIGTQPVSVVQTGTTVPSLGSLQPSSAVVGGAAFRLAVDGGPFTSAGIVQWNGANLATTYAGSSELTAIVPARDLTAAATAQISVTIPGGVSNSLGFTIDNPVPATTSLSPPRAIVAGAGFTLTVNGTGFVSGSTVLWNGSSRTTTFVSATQIAAAIAASDIAVAGAATVTVANPSPGGGTSSPGLTFNIENPAPGSTSLTPSSVAALGAQFTLTVNGSNFVASSSALWNGSALTTTYVSASQLTAVVPASNIASPGSASVTVSNPGPGGGTSAPLTFTIVNPAPAPTSLSPTNLVAGGAAFNLTVNGTDFESNSVVLWNGSPRTTIYGSANSLTASITAADIANPGTANVTVMTPAPGGGTSGAIAFIIDNPAPVAGSLSPASVISGSGAFTLTVTGSQFVPGATVEWNGSARTTTFVSDALVTAAIDSTDVAAAGTALVKVVNPAPGGGASKALLFTVDNPVPVAGALSPSSVTFGASGFTLTVTGSGFVNTSTVRWGSAALTTTFLTSGMLTAAVPASDVASAGKAYVLVTNPGPGGGASNVLSFSIDNPVPVAGSLSPASATAGGAAFSLAVHGSNFISGAAVLWNGANRATTFVSATQLTASILAGDIAAGGAATVSVSNPAPGGGPSNQLQFTIDNPAPTITALSPASATNGSAAFTLTVYGTGFQANSTVLWNGAARATTYVGPYRLTAAITAADIATVGAADVTVTTPAPGGGTSAAATFTIK
jgi:hypothetical protein